MIKLNALELSRRTRRVLYVDNIETTEELTQLTEAELLRVPNLGRMSLFEIKEALAKHDLTLKRQAPVTFLPATAIPWSSLTDEQKVAIAGCARLPGGKEMGETHFYNGGTTPVPEGVRRCPDPDLYVRVSVDGSNGRTASPTLVPSTKNTRLLSAPAAKRRGNSVSL